MNTDLGLLVLRLVVGVVIIAHGAIKIGWPISLGPGRGLTALRNTAGWFATLGFWPPLCWAFTSYVGESVGGILIVLGLGGPLGPGLVFGDMIVVTIVAHWPNGFWAARNGWEFPILLLFGSLAIGLIGFGAWSVDSALGLAYADWLNAWFIVAALGAVLLLAIRATRQVAAPSQQRNDADRQMRPPSGPRTAVGCPA